MLDMNQTSGGLTYPRWAYSDLPWSVHRIHDLRNVLALAAGHAGSLQSHDQRDAEALVQLKHTLESAMRIARELILAGKSHEIARQEISLATVVRSLVPALRGAVSNGVRIELDAPASGALVFASHAELDRILSNLVLNAADAMPHKGLLTIRVETILDDEDVRVGEDLSLVPFVRLTVGDSGEGIPPHLRSSVFEPYFTTKPHGTGIGLATVASTVAGLGGSVLIADGDTAGTRVHVNLPLVMATSTEPARR